VDEPLVVQNVLKAVEEHPVRAHAWSRGPRADLLPFVQKYVAMDNIKALAPVTGWLVIGFKPRMLNS
jgi:hypothetical protein